MKKEYMKPDMRVVEIKHRCRLLSGSPDGLNNQKLQMYKGGPEKQIEDEEYVF